MVYKSYEYDSFRIFTIQTDQFKNAHIEVVFQGDARTSKLTEMSFLSDIMCFSSQKYPTRKDLVIRMEELYNAYLYGVTSKVGNALLSNFIFDFLDPYYVPEEHYLEDCLAFLFDTIMHPNTKKNAFDYKSFQIVKSRFHSDIESLKENPVNYSLRQSLKEMYPESISSKSVLGDIMELESITPESLVDAYQNLFENSYCDIYVIGNLDMDKIAKLILKHFKNHVIKTHEQETFVKNKRIKEVKKKVENGKFVQSNLVMGYQMQGFNEQEYHSILAVFGEIFCGASLNSKLYQYLRNENSLCYRVQTIYQKFDEALLISVGLESKNKNLAVKLIQKAMKEMATGKFTMEELSMAKEQLCFALTMSLDNQNSIINNYVFHNLVGTPLLENRQNEIMAVTKEDIMKLAKKMRHVLVYELKEVSHEGN